MSSRILEVGPFLVTGSQGPNVTIFSAASLNPPHSQFTQRTSLRGTDTDRLAIQGSMCSFSKCKCTDSRTLWGCLPSPFISSLSAIGVTPVAHVLTGVTDQWWHSSPPSLDMAAASFLPDGFRQISWSWHLRGIL